MIAITITNEQSALRIDRRRLAAAVRAALKGEGLSDARISLAVVGDARIHALNRQFLAHDWPTDVLSFVLQQSDGHLEGEIVVSAERAVAESRRYGLEPDEELLLYVVHGALHLAGHDDARPPKRRAMRRREKECLARLGVVGQASRLAPSKSCPASTPARMPVKQGGSPR